MKRGNLTGEEYKTIRHTLGLSQAEAADFHGLKGTRTIKRWEKGGSFISDIACNKITALLVAVNEKIKADLGQLLALPREAKIMLIIYPDDCSGVVPGFDNLPPSVCTAMVKRVYIALKESGRTAGMVMFDQESYISFLMKNNLSDCRENREQWAYCKYQEENGE